MIPFLRHQLASPALLRQLRNLAAGAPDSAPVSLAIVLGRQGSDWLNALPTQGPFWYQARPAGGLYRLGIGHAFQVSSCGANRFAALELAFSGLASCWRNSAMPLAFCGFAFDECSQTPLPNALLAIPAILLETRNGLCQATLSTPAGRIDSAPAIWRDLLAPAAPVQRHRMLPAGDRTLADRAWLARVNAALRDIAGGRIDKIVLYRSRSLDADRPVAIGLLLDALVEQQAGSVIYAHGNGPTTFLGASPERLVRLSGRQIATDALAGTAWPGSQGLAAAKNRREQSLVAEAILDALAGLCTAPPRAAPVEIRRAGRLTHLRTRITGQAANGITLFDLLRSLHPTPAVGGFPGPAARDWLTRHGEQRGGWYSGGFGTLAANGDGEFSVALRSALISGRRVDLQAGVGIVAGSAALHELAETEAKMETLLAALAARPSTFKNALG